VNQEDRLLKYLRWLIFVCFALFAPLACGQSDTASTSELASKNETAESPHVGTVSAGLTASVPTMYWRDSTGNGTGCVCGGVNGGGYSGGGAPPKTFADPVPAGGCVTGVQVTYGGTCAAGPVFALNGTVLPQGSGSGSCTCGECFTSTATYTNAAGVPGYVYGGANTFAFQGGGFVLSYSDVTLTYGTSNTATTTTLGSGNNPSVFGQSVALTAHVASASGTPVGSVVFKDGATTLGTVAVNGAGDATFSATGLATGSHSITAVFTSGGCVFANSTSAALTQTVNKSATTTAVVSSVNPTIAGGSTTFTATVSATAPGAGTRTGTATFKDGATVLGTGAVNASGVATFATNALGVGTHSITVDYGGDTNFATSTSPAITQTVNQDGASLLLTSSVNPTTYGTSTTFTATVSSTGTGGTPTGNVAFKDGGATLGTVAVNASGVATFSTAALLGGSHTITADYAGDTKHTAATGTVTQTVDAGPSTTVVTSLTNPSVFGQSVTLKAAVTGSGPTATGTVTFSEGGVALGAPITLVGGAATISTAGLSVGTHAIVATFNGDTNYATSTSVAFSQVVNKAATSTVLVSGSNPSIVGASVTFTATVTATAPGAGTPTGTVTFDEGAIALGSGTLDASGVATFSTSALSVGSHTITAHYVTSASFAASTSNNVAQVVNKDGITATLASSLNPSTFGASVTFSATVTSTGGGGIPTGTVTFFDGAAMLGTGVLDATGVATYATSALLGGSHMISASYGGDGNHGTGSSAALAQIVNGADTATALASSVNPSVFGQSTTLTATVTSAIAGSITGSVTFSDGATVLGTSVLNAAGVATLSTSTFTVGTHSLSAVYGGNTNFVTSTSAALSQVVDLGATTTVVASSSNPSLIDSNVTFTATVAAKSPSAGTPSGTVTFKDGATILGTGTLGAGGIATFATTTLTVGAHSITAAYGGSASYDVSTSATLTQNVNAAAATVALKAAPSPATYGGAVTLTATLTGANGTPTGTIAFTDGVTALGNGTLSASGVATLSVPKLAAGTHTLGAAYSGDTTYATGTGTASLVVNKAATTTTLASSLNPSTTGAAVTFTATVASAAAGFTGQVEFFDGTTSLGTSPLAGTTATLSTSALTQTGHAITATYKGDANFATSTSAALTETVGAKPAGADAGSPGAGTDASVPGETGAPSDDSSGCGCRIEGPAGSAGGMGALFALAGVAVVAARRRRRS
jgi:MYXO-CTERM domain-containing protein